MMVEPAGRRWLTRAAHVYWRFARGMTLGVRIAVLTDDGQVLLVKHSYTPGWHFPGGGVEVGQTLREAVDVELWEEARIRLTAEPALVAVYLNRQQTKRDHVALYLARAFIQPETPQPNREIVDHGFFPLDQLPEGTTRATRARLEEIAGRQGLSPHW
jgi:8-oxo-dGTP pyrophosphatase MutT (NUDIX family)